MNKIVECVPNFSEGSRPEVIEKIADSFRGKPGVKLLDYSGDADHNRSVITVVGEPEAVKNSVIEAIGTAVQLIDLTNIEANIPAWVHRCCALLFLLRI